MGEIALYDHEAERCALATLFDACSIRGPGDVRAMLEKERLAVDDFHLPAHAEVFTVAVRLLKQQMPLEPVSMWDALRTSPAVSKAGGAQWVAALSAHGGMEFAFPGYSRTIRDLALRRRMVATARDLLAGAQNLGREPDLALADGSRALAAVGRHTAQMRSLQELLQVTLAELDEVSQGKREPVIPTGIRALDFAIGGLQPTLTIVGALPGVGKSSLFATVVQNLARAGKKVGVFSLEDDGEWISSRLLSAESGVTNFVMRNRRLSEHEMTNIHDGAGRIWSYGPNVLVDDRHGLSPQDVVQSARDMVLNRGVQVVLVDHLGELRYSSGRKDRYDLDVMEGLSDLRSIAKQYGVPVWVAAHLSRKADELGPDEAPRLSHFANSSAVERQARVALALTRPVGSPALTVHVLKQTHGKPGLKLELDFNGPAAMVRNDGGRVLKQEGEQ